jgi:hypothetical protein
VADACDVVLESFGGSVFFDLPERADVMFQVLSRDTTYMTARARAWAIYDAIFGDWTYGSAGWMLPRVFSDSISPCDAVTDWTASFGGVLSIDTDDKKEGTGSLKDNIAAPVIDTWYETCYNPTGSWDWSAKKHILFWFKCDRPNTAFGESIFRIFDTLGNNRWWNLTFSAGEWTAFKFLLSTGDGEDTSPDLALINRVYVRLQTADDTPFYKKIDHLKVGIEEYEAMIIEPLATPQYIGFDEKGRAEFSCNYIFKIKKL